MVESALRWESVPERRLLVVVPVPVPGEVPVEVVETLMVAGQPWCRVAGPARRVRWWHPVAVAAAVEPSSMRQAVVVSVVVVLVVLEVEAVAAEVMPERSRGWGAAVEAPANSWTSASHRGTLPCLRRGSSSRLVDSIRRPATSLRRVSAGSMTSSM